MATNRLLSHFDVILGEPLIDGTTRNKFRNRNLFRVVPSSVEDIVPSCIYDHLKKDADINHLRLINNEDFVENTEADVMMPGDEADDHEEISL